MKTGRATAALVYNRYRFSEDLMDRHAYEKGACVLDMLRWELGDDAASERSLITCASTNSGTPRPTISKSPSKRRRGQNLHWFFDQWLYGPGYPELEVAYEWRREQGLLKLSVKQVQGTEDGTRVFRFTAEIEIVTAEPGDVTEAERRARAIRSSSKKPSRISTSPANRGRE